MAKWQNGKMQWRTAYTQSKIHRERIGTKSQKTVKIPGGDKIWKPLANRQITQCDKLNKEHKTIDKILSNKKESLNKKIKG